MTQGDNFYSSRLSWWGTTQPPTFVSVAARTWVGISLSVAAAQWCWGFRVFQSGPASQYHLGLLWNSDTGDWLASRVFRVVPGVRPNNWLQTWLRPRIRLNPADYRLAVLVGSDYGRQNSLLTSPITRNGITVDHSFQTTAIWPPSAVLTLSTNANGVDLLVSAV